MSLRPSMLLKLVLAALVTLLGAGGCATYSDNVREAHSHIAQNRPEEAVVRINEQLGLESVERLPDEINKNKPLLLLERATVLQSLGEYELAARDMIAAEDHLEWLDLSNADTVEIAKYMYSQSAEDYRAPAYERLLLNSLNMLNFLGARDLEGARVEARRFTLLEQFFLDDEETSLLDGVLGFGNYMSGATFEASREYEQAARYYSRAWYYGMRDPELRERLTDLLALTGYKPRDLLQEDETALADLLAAAERRAAPSLSEYRDRHQNGDTLVVVQTGLAPWREAKRIPIVQAMSYTDNARHHRFDRNDRRQLRVMVDRGVIDSVNFPMLTDRNTPPQRPVQLEVDGRRIDIGARVDIASQVEKAYAHIMPSMMVAAITRLITRVAAGEASSAAVKASGGDEGLGALARLGVQGAMNLADKPDTRSWMMLPARIRIARVQLGSASPTLTARIGGQSDQKRIDIQPRSLNVVNFSRVR